jgi:hypothetical protein
VLPLCKELFLFDVTSRRLVEYGAVGPLSSVYNGNPDCHNHSYLTSDDDDGYNAEVVSTEMINKYTSQPS